MREAAKAFLDGYKNYPEGDRAPDSLLWLGKALTSLKKTEAGVQRARRTGQSVYGPKLTLGGQGGGEDRARRREVRRVSGVAAVQCACHPRGGGGPSPEAAGDGPPPPRG